MKTRRIIAAIAALTQMSSAFSCGKDSSSSETGGNTAVASSAEGKTETSESASEDSTDNSKEDATEKSTKGSSDNKEDTSKSGSTESEEASTEAASEGSTDAKVTTSAAAAGNSGSKATTTKPASGGTAVTTAASGSSSEEEEKSYTAEITLGSSIKYTGENVEVDGSTVKITSGGDYIFTGKLTDGQIYVSTKTEDKVTVILNGVDIHCTTGPAIFINEAKKCTVKVKEGSVNNLSDEAKDKINDGVIFSNDTLRIKGNGTLNITAGNAHGLASDDDVIIENSICNIKAKKSGILAHDDITINGGTLNIVGGTNGMKSKGTININGGTAYVVGGDKEEKSSVYAAMGFNYTDGYLFAAGYQVTPPNTSATPYIVVDLGSSVEAGTAVKLALNGKEAANWKPENNFRSIFMLSPEISSGSKFTISLDGESQGEFEVESGKNLFEI